MIKAKLGATAAVIGCLTLGLILLVQPSIAQGVRARSRTVTVVVTNNVFRVGGECNGRGVVNSQPGSSPGRGRRCDGHFNFAIAGTPQSHVLGWLNYNSDFESVIADSFTWIHVAVAGADAQVLGKAFLNGRPGFNFLLTAHDGGDHPGSPDYFRLQVSHTVGKTTVIDYDNVRGAPNTLFIAGYPSAKVLSGDVEVRTGLFAPPVLSNLSISPSSVVGGASSKATATLSAKALAGGFDATVSSNNPAAKVPASITVPFGSTSTEFKVTTVPVASAQVATITATANGGTVSSTLTMTAAQLANVGIVPDKVNHGKSVVLSIALSGAAPPANAVVTLISNTPSVVKVPATVTIHSGQSSATVDLTAGNVSKKTVVTITVIYLGVAKTAQVTVS